MTCIQLIVTAVLWCAEKRGNTEEQDMALENGTEAPWAGTTL